MENLTENNEIQLAVDGFRKDIKVLEHRIANKDYHIKQMKGFVGNYLSLFESKFDSNESEFTYEQMEEYVTAANFMEVRYGRKGLQRRVLEVMNNLNF